jgi:hypothetical protein
MIWSFPSNSRRQKTWENTKSLFYQAKPRIARMTLLAKGFSGSYAGRIATSPESVTAL